MKTEKPTYGLYLSKDADSIKAETDKYSGEKHGRAEIRVVHIDDESRVRNGIDSPFNDLIFYCQWSKEPRTFAWSVEFKNPFKIDLSTAERMLKVLKQAQRAQQKFVVRPESFGQYCVLMASALGISKFVQATTDGSWSYAETQHNIYEIAQAQHAIDSAIAKKQAEQFKQAEPIHTFPGWAGQVS